MASTPGNLSRSREHNPKFLIRPLLGFLTQDEESSGLIDAEHILGKGWFLLDVQVHLANPDPELVEGGQLLALFVDPKIGRGRRRNGDDDD